MNALIETALSHDDTTMMLAAILSLLLALLFIITLRFYAKWFLAREQVPQMMEGRSRFLWVTPIRNLHDFLTVDIAHDLPCSAKGVEPSIISSMPQFVFQGEDHGLECVICLSLFENDQRGKKLALCNHAFHVECIDMWLHSHRTCPVCRAPAVANVCDGNAIESSSGANNVMNNENHQELVETTSDNISGEMRVSANADPRRLENIVIVVPNAESNELSDAFQRK